MVQSKNINWFYVVLVLFVVALPFSEALISVSGVLLFVTAFFYQGKKSLAQKLGKNRELLVYSSIYLVYLLGSIFSSDTKWILYDLQKNIPYLIIPFAFIIAKPIKAEDLYNLLKIFVVAVVGSALITMVNFYMQDEVSVLNAQEFGFIHHIRFSFQLIFSMIIISVFLFRNWNRAGRLLLAATTVTFLFLLTFLLWHQSFTGLIAFLGTAFVGLILLIFQLKKAVWRTLAISAIALLVIIPSAYIYYAVDRYYTVDKIDLAELEKETAKGNPYKHDLDNAQVENGHFIGLYNSENEMEDAWNKRAHLKCNEKDRNGYGVKYTLVRYLTSKNLRKDAEGVESLSKDDIRNIESGISNYLLADKGISLYPRIYTTIWELDTYLKTGYANNQSISQRIEYIKAAVTIIKEDFWFGVGTGDWKAAYKAAFEKNKSQMNPARYGDAHNQYLNYMVKFGLIGLIWILFAIAYPVIQTNSYKNPIFFLFLLSMLIANFGDSNFETHVGSSFFVLFYCLFVSTEIREESRI